jgi:4-amino-4-deoxychorismate lyase
MPAEGPLRDGNGPGFRLIETLRWEPADGFLRLGRHLDRLAGSSRELGFGYDAGRTRQALEQAVAGKEMPQRLRLLLGPDGLPEATAQPFQPLPEGAVWKLRLAAARLSSTDRLLRHKTTRRETYERARAEYPAMRFCCATSAERSAKARSRISSWSSATASSSPRRSGAGFWQAYCARN